MPMAFHAERVFPLPPAEAWSVPADTDHRNRMLGLPQVSYGEPREDAKGPWRPASARLPGGIALRRRERPFEWVRERRYKVARDFEEGPFTRFRGGVELHPEGEGTRVRVFAELEPSGLSAA